MPKIKSNRSAMKRFKVTAKGKIKRGRGFRRHLLSTKAKKRKRRLRKPATVSPQELTNIRKLVPYL